MMATRNIFDLAEDCRIAEALGSFTNAENRIVLDEDHVHGPMLGIGDANGEGGTSMCLTPELAMELGVVLVEWAKAYGLTTGKTPAEIVRHQNDRLEVR